MLNLTIKTLEQILDLSDEEFDAFLEGIARGNGVITLEVE